MPGTVGASTLRAMQEIRPYGQRIRMCMRICVYACIHSSMRMYLYTHRAFMSHDDAFGVYIYLQPSADVFYRGPRDRVDVLGASGTRLNIRSRDVLPALLGMAPQRDKQLKANLPSTSKSMILGRFPGISM